MKVLREMLKDLTESWIFIPVFVLLSFVAIVYVYCFVAEHEILSVKQKASFENHEFTIKAICRPVEAFTSAPSVNVRLNDLEIVTTMVNSGYDLTTDCINSSVKNVRLVESERKVEIYMKDGKIKEIPIIYNDSK
jgi:hypothetical protein